MNDWRYDTPPGSISASRLNNLTTTFQDSDSDQSPSEASAPLRTVVFIDYQNMYREARRAFGWEDRPGHFGNLKPIAMGRMLTQGPERELVQVRVYTGVPGSKRDKFGYQIMQRRIASWVAANPKCVEVFPRPLKYPPNSNEGREKGVDVELAIDLVRLAMDNEFDAAVIASADTDLQPPIEFVLNRFPEKKVETAAYFPETGYEAYAAEPLDVPAGVHRRQKLSKKSFEKAVADRHNFVTASAKPETVVEKSRWDKISRRLSPVR